MNTVRIRKQGGAAIVTIPSDFLKRLNIDIGSELELSIIDKENLLVHPLRKRPINRTRYTLKELLKGVTQKKIKCLNKETEWSRSGDPVGREIE